MKELDSYINSIMAEIYQSKKEYIEDCKLCFLNETEQIQEKIENADTDLLLDELKKHNWTTIYKDYCKAIKYELMKRLDFKERI